MKDVAQKKTSDATQAYNCIAWAFEDNRRWWWPSRRSFWPVSIEGLNELEAFLSWFESDGWTESDSIKPKPGYKKICLFLKNGKPTHASRLLSNGLWTSKLGQNIDISHDYFELDGPAYGKASLVFEKEET